MKLKLEKLNKSHLSNPLVAPKLFTGVWKIGEVREVQDKTGYDLLSKFHGLFSIVKDEKPAANKMVEKASVTMEAPQGAAREMVNKAGRPPKKLER